MSLYYKKILYIEIFILLISFSFSGCKRLQKAADQDVVPVQIMKVKLDDFKKALDYVGDIKAQDQAVVYPKVGGKIIEKIKKEGSAIKKDEVIAYIDRDEVGFEFKKSPIESPLAGLVGRIYIDKGMAVSPQSPIALVVNIDNVRVELDIPEKFLPVIKLNQKAKINVDAYPDKVFEGKITEISPVVDLNTRTFPIEITILNNDHYLKPGMFARVKLIIEEKEQVPAIIKEAIIGKKPNAYVYVLNQDIAYQRPVRLGIRQGPVYEVIEGLKKGESVVIMGQQKLHEGTKVSIQNNNKGEYK